MTPYSLRRRLALGLTLAAALIGVVALVDTWAEAVRTAQGLSDRVLEGSALAIAERVTVDEGGGLEVDIPFAALEMLASAAEDQVFYRVDAPAGTFLTGYDALTVLVPGEDGVAFADGRFGAVPIRSATLLRQISTGADSVAFTVTVAESTRARSALARQILIRSAVRILVLIGCIVAIVWGAVTLAFRPLDRLGAAIAERTPDDLRPLQAQVPLEAAPLAGAINSFMARLEGAVAALRHFTGNASHQLRTPLATLRTQLALARVDAAATGLALVPLDLAALAREVTGEALPAATEAGIDLGYEGDAQAKVLADPVLAAELLRNLVDNALRYAGQGAVVTVRVARDRAAVVLQVEDDGPGLPPDRLAALQAASRPKRMAPATGAVSGTGGSGLGLAIVAEIAALFGADCSFGPGTAGRGVSVSCRFPAPEEG
jgi:two-component system, OmpR family, sensor histidine kinase TctE